MSALCQKQTLRAAAIVLAAIARMSPPVICSARRPGNAQTFFRENSYMLVWDSAPGVCRRFGALCPFIRQSRNESEVVKPLYPLLVFTIPEHLFHDRLEQKIKFIWPFVAAAKTRFRGKISDQKITLPAFSSPHQPRAIFLSQVLFSAIRSKPLLMMRPPICSLSPKVFKPSR
jgi:hypothetical protein